MKFSTTLSVLVILTTAFCLGGCAQDSDSLIAPQASIDTVTAVDRQGNESAWTQIRYNYDPSDVAIDSQ
jgi:hypothetical protein